MIQPGQHFLGAAGFYPRWNDRTIDHQHWEAQLPGGDQLGFGALAARVLAHQQVDGVIPQQLYVALRVERSAIDHQIVVRQQRWPVGRIDKSQQVVMLRLGGKGLHMHPPQRQHDAAGRSRQSSHGCGNVGNMAPVIARTRRPGRAGERYMPSACQPGGFDGVAAHCRGKGMGRINQMRHPLVAQIVSQPGYAPKAANAHRHRLRVGGLRPAGVTQRCRDSLGRQQARQRAGFGGAAQQEDVRHG